MSDKGHKSAIELPGGIDLPDYIIEIIDFRNKKTSTGLSGYQGIKGSNGGCHFRCPKGKQKI